jgi:primary-amine oxidase
MHTHVLNWKVDVDILGTNNTMGCHKVVPAEVKYDWSPTPRKTMKLVRSELKNEDEAKLNWPSNSHAMYLIYNKEEKNKFGEDRAWRIMPSRKFLHIPFLPLFFRDLTPIRPL